MAAPAPDYDLVLMLDPSATDDRRAKVLDDTRNLVATRGEIIGEEDWGLRAMAYEINHKPESEYHLLQFHADADLLATLGRTLRITDGVVRHRIIRLRPGTQAAPPRPDRPERGDRPDRGERPERGDRPERPSPGAGAARS